MIDEDLRDRSGEVIAEKFRLTKRLGAGGMGEVYRALNEMVGREVAIKILKPEYARSADVVQRVQREARAANKVRHPNIVDVLDVFPDTNGAPVIVQELLVGEDLSTFVRARGAALSEAEALDLMTPVTDALAAAHAAGIMHRDLKLENVFLDRRSGVAVPKVLDFGLSRDIGEDAVSRLTTTGVAMGTPMYMSPEQVQGQRDIDQRTDVWALGVMLYELVAGRLPFEGDSLGAIFVKVCTADPPSLRTLAPGVSAGYVGIVERCLQRDRTNRFEHAGALVASPTLVSGVVGYVVEVQQVLASLSPEQNAQLVGFDASFLPLLADETARLDVLSTRAVNEGIVVDVAIADRKAQAEAASSRGVALRQQGARALRRALLGQESDLAALEQAVGNASTAASLASGLEFVAGQIEHQLAHGDADRRSLLARVKLTAENAASLRVAAKDVLTTDEAASAVAQTGVTQRALDLQDGRVMRIVDWVNRAFRDANAVNGAIAVPKLGDLEALFVNTRRAVAKVDPAPSPPTG